MIPRLREHKQWFCVNWGVLYLFCFYFCGLSGSWYLKLLSKIKPWIYFFPFSSIEIFGWIRKIHRQEFSVERQTNFFDWGIINIDWDVQILSVQIKFEKYVQLSKQHEDQDTAYFHHPRKSFCAPFWSISYQGAIAVLISVTIH